jgi:hypothetical protein
MWIREQNKKNQRSLLQAPVTHPVALVRVWDQEKK